MRAREMRRSGAEFDGTGFRIHRLHDCQGITVVSRCAQLIAAALETLLHRDADALDRRSGIMAQIDQALQSLAVGQESSNSTWSPSLRYLLDTMTGNSFCLVKE